MEGDLISRDALLKNLRGSKAELKRILDGLTYATEWRICEGRVASFTDIILRVKEAPAIDAEPVRHGEWKDFGLGFMMLFTCSVCRRQAINGGSQPYPYCPNCGAKMRKDNESE